MAKPKDEKNSVGIVTQPNTTNDGTPGRTTYTLAGQQVSVDVPGFAFGGGKVPQATTAPASTNPLPVGNENVYRYGGTNTNTNGSGSTSRTPNVLVGDHATPTAQDDDLLQMYSSGSQAGRALGQYVGKVGVPEKQTSGRGGGGSTLPELPAELANQIADAYARSQGTGPDAWQNRYQAEIDGMRGQRYGDYDSRYIPQINGLVDRLLNRDSFSYNWSDDPLYRQYAARYQQAARQGMQDTMGQAAAMTGGYGNSYATAAANQAYANQMAGLNDQAMNLYQLAAENYDRDTNNLRTNLQQLEQREAANRGNYDTDRATYYDRQDADLNNLLNQQAMDYQMWQDQVARDQYERELAWNQYAYWNDLYHNKYNYKK